MCLWKKLSLPVLPQYWVVKLGPHILKQLFCLKVPIFCFEKESWEVTLAALEFVISCQSFLSNWGDKLEPRQGTMHVTFHIQTLKSDILYVSLLRFGFGEGILLQSQQSWPQFSCLCLLSPGLIWVYGNGYEYFS